MLGDFKEFGTINPELRTDTPLKVIEINARSRSDSEML